MFWGLILQPNKHYFQEVEMSFHLSMAVLDVSITDNQTVNVIASKNDTNFLICTLTKGSNWQALLNLNFEKGSKVSFFCSGKNNVHLTGYLNKPYKEGKKRRDKETEAEEIEEITAEEEEKEGQKKYALATDKQLKRKARFSPKMIWKMKRLKRDSDDVEMLESNMSKDTKNLDANEIVDEEKEQEEEQDEEEEKEEGEEEGEEEEEEEGKKTDNNDDDDDDNEDNEDDDDYDGDGSNNEDEDEDDDEDEDEDDYEDDDDDDGKLKSSKKTIDDSENKEKKVRGDNSFEYNSRKKPKKSKLVETKKQSKYQQEKILAEQNIQTKEYKKKSKLVKIIDIKKGTGAVAKAGKMVSVYYVGRLRNGNKFIEEKGGDGLQFKIGRDQVIEGLDIGIAGMRVGGKRRILVPPILGYGETGYFPYVPPNSKLTFEVELKNVRNV